MEEEAIIKVLVFADARIGCSITKFLIDQFHSDVVAVINIGNKDIIKLCEESNVPHYSCQNEAEIIKKIAHKDIDLGILAWWPNIISKDLIGLPKYGFVNTHNSLLPHNRGKHPYFWAIVEERPYGVTLHKVDEGIDTGDIVAQREIRYGWEDTAGTVYEKSLKEMISLFCEEYPKLRNGDFNLKPQGDFGSFHCGKEIEIASEIDLDAVYTARELINILRARTTSTSFPASFFKDGKDIYRVKVIVEKE